jgi:hypothetical protein
MIPFLPRREFPVPSLTVFVLLQVLDIVTTLIGLRMGASESSVFIGRLMRVGPLEALLIAKLFAAALAAIALKMGRGRMVVFLNYWFVAVVSWNLAVILISGLRA